MLLLDAFGQTDRGSILFCHWLAFSLLEQKRSQEYSCSLASTSQEYSLIL